MPQLTVITPIPTAAVAVVGFNTEGGVGRPATTAPIRKLTADAKPLTDDTGKLGGAVVGKIVSTGSNSSAVGAADSRSGRDVEQERIVCGGGSSRATAAFNSSSMGADSHGSSSRDWGTRDRSRSGGRGGGGASGESDEIRSVVDSSGLNHDLTAVSSTYVATSISQA